MQYAKHHWEVGDYVPGLQGEGFTAAHWFLPEELCELFEKQEVEILEMADLEGLSSHHRKETNRLQGPGKVENVDGNSAENLHTSISCRQF